MNRNNRNLREVSGTVTYSDPLTSFLYQLMRDELPAGIVEKIVRDIVNEPEECLYTNGWLAQYANNLSEELKNAASNKLKKALNVAFDNTKKEDKRVTGDFSLINEDSTILEEKIRNESNIEEEIDDENEEPAVDDAKGAVQQMVEHGHISKEEGESLKQEIDGVATDKCHDTGGPDTARRKYYFEKGFAVPPPAFRRINTSAVEVKPDAEKEKLTTDEAKNMIERAIEKSEIIEGISQVNNDSNKLENAVKKQDVEEENRINEE
jgi:hypothetical protein